MTTPIEQLIKQYSAGAYQLKKLRDGYDKQDPLQLEDDKIVSDMISDMRFAIDWMKRGRRPGNRKGAERTDIYRQREIAKTLSEAQNADFSDADKLRLVECLLTLSERERACFLLHMAHGLTQEEIGARLKVSRASVRKYLDRAKDKIQQEIS